MSAKWNCPACGGKHKTRGEVEFCLLSALKLARSELAAYRGHGSTFDLDARKRATREMTELLREVMSAHRDKQSAEYNECEIPGQACMWCFKAERAIKECS